MLADIRGFLRYLGARMAEDRSRQSAAALTFVSLFALVPLLTVFYSILSMVPAFDTLGERLQGIVDVHAIDRVVLEKGHGDLKGVCERDFARRSAPGGADRASLG